MYLKKLIRLEVYPFTGLQIVHLFMFSNKYNYFMFFNRISYTSQLEIDRPLSNISAFEEFPLTTPLLGGVHRFKTSKFNGIGSDVIWAAFG